MRRIGGLQDPTMCLLPYSKRGQLRAGLEDRREGEAVREERGSVAEHAGEGNESSLWLAVLDVGLDEFVVGEGGGSACMARAAAAAANDGRRMRRRSRGCAWLG